MNTIDDLIHARTHFTINISKTVEKDSTLPKGQ